ncbi:PREDICTED: putative nuclease HARBI1 [Trachymyrmex cornetzi]|uniref:putative nuclease HARBI1 n=1 Tax=Trachymyrmex cornetzi TaxID=471704 RepID=UPI00084EF0A6|nr:PREDICTED: putative nuclease HARBI1 [Trachymyrmex cornetzi]
MRNVLQRVWQIERRLERRLLRDHANPLALPQNEFMDIFRLSPDLALYLINELRHDLQPQRISGLAPELQVLTVLQFYGQGCYQRSVGNQFQHNMSQTSPFPGAIGAIDCTFINILGPVEHEEAYVNHHGNHTLNVQAIVDPDFLILSINARFPDARNDSYIWNNSPIRRAMEYCYNRGERQTWLIGDAGYPLEPWLMTPLADYPIGTRQFEYTMQLCSSCNCVERFNGVFKSLWRCCSYQRVLMYEPELADRIINACAILHNMRIHARLPVDQFLNDQDAGLPEDPVYIHHEEDNEPVRNLALARRIQKQIMADRFPDLPDGDDL